MGWDLEGMYICGRYMDAVNIKGLVTNSRVAYGGEVQHMVKIEKGFSLFKGAVVREPGEVVIIENKFITQVMDNNA